MHAGFKALKWTFSVRNEMVFSRSKAFENLTVNLRVICGSQLSLGFLIYRHYETETRHNMRFCVMNSPGRGRGTQSSCRKGNS